MRLLKLSQPASFAGSLRARWIQQGEFRLHYREAGALDALPDRVEGDEGPVCGLGFVLSRKLCRRATRRNLIRRTARECLLEHLRTVPVQDAEAGLPVLVLRLHSRLDPQWRSQQSRALRRYLRATLSQMFVRWEQLRRRTPSR